MIAESYVSFDTAKLLKEAGFDEVCRSAYYATGNSAVMYERNSMLSPGYVSRPTQALAARWLREVYGLHVMISPYYDCSVDAEGKIVDKRMYWGYMILYAATGNLAEDNDERFDNYEQALEVGLQKVIKLIKK